MEADTDEVEEVLARISPDRTVLPVRPSLPGPSVPGPSVPGPMELTAKEEKKVMKFIRNTCGCTRNNGGPCSTIFTTTHIKKMRMECIGLSRDNHDVALLGQIVACTNFSEGVVVESRHIAAKVCVL